MAKPTSEHRKHTEPSSLLKVCRMPRYTQTTQTHTLARGLAPPNKRLFHHCRKEVMRHFPAAMKRQAFHMPAIVVTHMTWGPCRRSCKALGAASKTSTAPTRLAHSAGTASGVITPSCHCRDVRCTCMLTSIHLNTGDILRRHVGLKQIMAIDNSVALHVVAHKSIFNSVEKQNQVFS